MYAPYKSHNDATLSYLEDALHRFHTFNNVFLLCRTGNKVKVKANGLRRDHVKKPKVDQEPNAATGMLSKKLREMNAWRDYIGHKIDVSKEMDANFHSPKIELESHWVDRSHP